MSRRKPRYERISPFAFHRAKQRASFCSDAFKERGRVLAQACNKLSAGSRVKVTIRPPAVSIIDRSIRGRGSSGFVGVGNSLSRILFRKMRFQDQLINFLRLRDINRREGSPRACFLNLTSDALW